MPRPPVQPALDEEQIEKLASLGCTDDEIAELARISDRTLQKRFAHALRAGRAQMKHNLRKMQWRAAERGNVTMLIWLGKQYLHQTDVADKIRMLELIDLLNKRRELEQQRAIVVELTEQRAAPHAIPDDIATTATNHD